MTITPPVLKLYYYTGAAWVDITAYMQTTNINGNWGHSTADHTDRLANTGELTITLKNYAGEFDPDDADCLTGWGKNSPVRFTITYDGIEYVRFYGKVDGIRFSDPDKFTHFANVTVVDYLNYIYKYPLTLPTIELNKRGDEALSTIITAIGKTPLATAYSEGVNTFDAVFDTVSTNTKGGTEVNKIVMSEMGYFYARKDRVNGETLVFESANDRHGLRTVKRLPKLIADCSHITDEDGVYITDEDGNRIIGNEAEDAHINSTETSFTRTHGDNIINRVVITAYPKEVDTVETVLYKLDNPIKLASGETKTVKGSYTNATTKKACNAISTSMSVTDYSMNKKKDGTGTNLTASMTITPTFGTEAPSFEITNASAYTAWVRVIEARGYGVYQNTTLEETLNDTASQTAYGMSELKLDQKYQRDTANGVAEGAKILEDGKDPATRLETYTMFANTSSQHMMAFLHVDIGDLVQITESEANIAGYYYVQGVSFSVQSGNIIQFTWVLKEETLTHGLTEVATEYTDNSDQAIDFGVVKDILDVEERTIILSVYPHRLASGQYLLMIGNCDFSGVDNTYSLLQLKYASGSTMYMAYVTYMYDGVNSFGDKYADWNTHPTTTNMPINVWSRVGITYKPKSGIAIPSFYLNGSPEVTTSSSQPVGTPYSEEALKLTIGGMYYPNGIPDQFINYFDGVIKSVKIYNRILSAAEIAAEYAGTPITDGLVFWGPCVSAKNTASYYDEALTESQKLVDKIHGKLGTPKGEPTCREII